MDLKSFMAGLDTAQRKELADACDTSTGHLQNVMYGYRTCAPELAVRLERITVGAITRKDMRPDDWQDIWPELAAPIAPRPQPKRTTASAATAG
jgi:DNA-binding transcriptional regulator YdaS (Cro superfamily)